MMFYLELPKVLHTTSRLREVCGTEWSKFGKILQEFSSQSLLCGEPARRPTEGTVFKNPSARAKLLKKRIKRRGTYYSYDLTENYFDLFT